ncbi:TerD family protein [Nakamurella flavida]|uniref:TerD family protein n=1 Tax=Nakamurella flavida TaxID=363630 RepID=A0A939C7I9_9ACTN|nr:TerD family protein [Nakamurella flavida]MBM9478217.1 TerD family protein [Nakamurella flavida]MDP9778561.1 tellurium resistance protein TerD [Nakamurella flavida]
MAVPMKRGANVALTQEIPTLKGVVLGVRWNAGAEHVLADNLVAATILCDRQAQAPSDEYFVFFNQLTSPDLSVAQLSAAVGDDDEQIEVDLGDVPADIHRIVVVLYVNDGPGARRTLGQLRDCRIRVLDLADGTELVQSENLAPQLRSETAICLGELYRHPSGWKFKVIGQGYENGVAGIAADYGVPL